MILRAAALAFWVACLVFVFVPTHGKTSPPFHGGKPVQPKYSPARGL